MPPVPCTRPKRVKLAGIREQVPEDPLDEPRVQRLRRQARVDIHLGLEPPRPRHALVLCDRALEEGVDGDGSAPGGLPRGRRAVMRKLVDDANRAQRDYWNERSGPTWVRHQEDLDAMLRGIGLATIDRLAPRAGERVLDVGCGCGETTVELGRRIGAGGSVLGLDLSGPMLARARERARDLPQVRLLEADVQTHPFATASLDAAFSRFGVMFFADPVAAFGNVRAALRPGGRLGFVCWQELRNNPWCMVPLAAVAKHVPLPPPPSPEEPGPFSLGDPDRVRGILERAGLGEVAIEALEVAISPGGSRSLEDAVDFIMLVGPSARIVRELPDDRKAVVREAIAEALAPFAGPEGVRLGGACWVVTARHPA